MNTLKCLGIYLPIGNKHLHNFVGGLITVFTETAFVE